MHYTWYLSEGRWLWEGWKVSQHLPSCTPFSAMLRKAWLAHTSLSRVLKEPSSLARLPLWNHTLVALSLHSSHKHHLLWFYTTWFYRAPQGLGNCSLVCFVVSRGCLNPHPLTECWDYLVLVGKGWCMVPVCWWKESVVMYWKATAKT